MSDVSPSTIKESPELQERLSKATTTAEIEQILHSEAIRLGLVVPDAIDSTILHATSLADAPQPTRFARTEIIAGKKFVFEGDSEAEVDRQVVSAFKTAAALQSPTTTQPTEQARDAATGRFTSPAEKQADDETKAALLLQFQLGQIDAATYLEKSGAVADYLEKSGVPIEDLKSTIQEKQDARFQQSWAQATEAFLRSPAGADWPGGRNMEIAGNLIAADPELVDAEDKVEVLAAVWRHMKENNLTVKNEELELHSRIAEARTPSELAAALQVPERQKAIVDARSMGSSLFGR